MSFVARRVSLSRAVLLLVACLTAASAPSKASQAQGGGQSVKLEKIEFKGLERVTEAEALAKSGLTVGQTVSVDAVEAAADRLLASGLFANLSYKIKGTTDKAVLTFEVVEPKMTMPVRFDNFVWFTDEELAAAVRRKFPAFDGNAPEQGNAPELIRQALEDLLREKKIEGKVEYSLGADSSGRKVEHLFTVKGPGLRVCKLNYAGARAIAEETLVTKSAGIFDNDFSRAYVANYVESSLLPLYQERGYLRAAFSPPRAVPDSSPECQGVAVTLTVDEGSIYVWKAAEWEGNAGLTADELNAALGMRPREIANVVKITNGLTRVRRAYGRKGYLGVRITPASDTDDSERTVTYRFRVEEGEQYRMGELTITGLDEVSANNLRGRWRLLHKDVYDEGYVDEFIKKAVPEFQKDALRNGTPVPNFKVQGKATPDHDKHTVDVALDFKAEPAAPKPPTIPSP
ncbi:MAG TPA: POTRA domain-containing protein [Pyrinomonadaceae bacterium]|nr:POTRA domain-containing protein [Pyrinomonadaceae bacterium]